MDNQLDWFIRKVNREYSYDENRKYIPVIVDPASIIMVTSVIIEVIKLIKRCRTERETINVAHNPSSFEKRVLYRIIRKKLGWKEYFRNRHTLANSILNTGASMSEDKIFNLFEEVS